jgi:hypothetical protein
MALKENYKDDILDTSQNVKRKYQMENNGDGTVSFTDVTEYTQQGDSFGSGDINATNGKVNTLESDIGEINDNLSELEYKSMSITTSTTYADIASLVEASLLKGKVPHIIADFTYENNVWHKCLLNYARHGYGSVNSMTFYNQIYNADIGINFTGSGAQGSYTFSNAILYY